MALKSLETKLVSRFHLDPSFCTAGVNGFGQDMIKPIDNWNAI